MILKLNHDQCAIIDNEDYDKIRGISWYSWRSKNGRYYVRGYANVTKPTWVLLHRVLLDNPRGLIDHIDGNPLNNKRSNLRICTCAQNLHNRGKTRLNTSGYKGVSWDVLNKKWQVNIGVGGIRYKIGRFVTKEDAALAYNEAAIAMHGEFAMLNNIQR
jgi:hypothetical protein